MAELDPRIVRVSLQIGGQLKVYNAEGTDNERALMVSSTGCKFANALQNEAEVKIANLSKADRDYLLTACSPFNKSTEKKLLILEAGRKSYGVTKIFQGNIVSCAPSQPPDITLTFKCQTGAASKTKIVASAQAAATPLSAIAAQVASDNDVSLRFEATDKTISNYAYTGGALNQVGKVGDAGGVDAYVDDEELIVKDAGVPLKGVMRVLNADSGMIGIPEVTEHGINVTYLLDAQSKCGGALQVQSKIYVALSGTYSIFKLKWSISTRDKPFYWIAESLRKGDDGQAVKPNPVQKKKAGKR